MRLNNDRIVLRSPTMKDATQILAWENEGEVVVLSEHQGGLRLKDIENYISKIKDVYIDRQLRWIIVEEKEDVGTIDIFNIDFEAGFAHVGILIADKKKRRRGLAKGALALVAGYCHDVLKLHRLLADVQAHNKVSQSFFGSMGFEKKIMRSEIIRYERDIAD